MLLSSISVCTFMALYLGKIVSAAVTAGMSLGQMKVQMNHECMINILLNMSGRGSLKKKKKKLQFTILMVASNGIVKI